MHHGEHESHIRVEVADTQGHLRVDPRRIEALAREVLLGEGRRRAEVSVALVDDATIHRANRAFLDHDWPTDVISFPLSGPEEPTLAGELVVSAETASRVAAQDRADPQAELALYIVHGLLHLCGYDDHEPEDARRMRAREAEVLGRLGWPPETFARPRPQGDGPRREELPCRC